MQYVLAVDAGTTSLKGVLFDTSGNPVASDLVEYDLHKPQTDIVELDSEVYWQALATVVRNILDKSRVDPQMIIAMGITSQGETLTVVDRNGRPLRRSIVWLDNRSRAEAAEIGREFDLDEVYRITGQQKILPTWTATRIAWVAGRLANRLRGMDGNDGFGPDGNSAERARFGPRVVQPAGFHVYGVDRQHCQVGVS